jgi:hypothetical protein
LQIFRWHLHCKQSHFLTFCGTNLSQGFYVKQELGFSIFSTQGKFNTRIYNKRQFSIPIANFHFLDVSIIHGVSIFRLVRFAGICFKVSDFNEWYRFHKLLKTFTKDYYRYKYLISTVLHLIKKDNSHFTFLWWRY